MEVTPNAFTIITPANGSGTLSYQWQRNTTGCSGPWSNISGATGTAYDATGVTIATYYQIVSISTLNSVQCSAPSNCISVTPNSVTPGTISGNRTVCHGGDPNPFTVSIAATGSNLTYQWQMSLTGGAGPWTDIPVLLTLLMTNLDQLLKQPILEELSFQLSVVQIVLLLRILLQFLLMM